MKYKLLILLALVTVTGCGEITNLSKHLHSSLSGLNRKITLYNSNGGIIREWVTQAKVEDKGGTCFFVVNGKAITVSGTFIIEEL